MEPMTLGSPSGSLATTTNPYLPSFLMGDANVPTTPRNNTLSPNKGGRNLSFATSPGPNSPQEYNRSTVGQKTLFGGYQQTPSNASGYQSGTPIQSHNSASGPPTQGLFDSLRNEDCHLQTPNRSMLLQSQFGTPNQSQSHNDSPFGINQSYQQPHLHPEQQQMGGYDSFLGNNCVSFNAPSSIVSPLGAATALTSPSNAVPNSSYMLQCPRPQRYSEFWVTVYGFSSTATCTILQHFAQCGTIVDKVFPPQNGNWMHLKYSSRLECDKALNYNEKILNNNIMIGVTQCKDKSIVDKENRSDFHTHTSTVRPLTQSAYKTAQTDKAFIPSPNAPQKSSGIMNKTMDLIFGW